MRVYSRMHNQAAENAFADVSTYPVYRWLRLWIQGYRYNVTAKEAAAIARINCGNSTRKFGSHILVRAHTRSHWPQKEHDRKNCDYAFCHRFRPWHIITYESNALLFYIRYYVC